MNWMWHGIRRRVATVRSDHEGAGTAPGRPVPGPAPAGFDPAVCPTGALSRDADRILVDYPRCIHCLRCARSDPPLSFEPGYERPGLNREPLPPPFRHSIHVRVLDAGDCGACLNEIRQLTGPVYSLHRFGVYITPTPRNADVLLVVGPVTVGMEDALRATYDAMPEPKRVLAVGACALSGGIFRGSFTARGGVGGTAGIPVDGVVPGCPPPPLAILEGLRRVMGQRATGWSDGRHEA